MSENELSLNFELGKSMAPGFFKSTLACGFYVTYIYLQRSHVTTSQYLREYYMNCSPGHITTNHTQPVSKPSFTK